MPGSRFTLKPRHIVFFALGAGCDHAGAWTARDGQKRAGVGFPSTVQNNSKQIMTILGKEWIGTTIVASTLAFGLQFPAFADEPPKFVSDADRAHIATLNDEFHPEPASQSTNSFLDGKSLVASGESNINPKNSDTELSLTGSMTEGPEKKRLALPMDGATVDTIIVSDGDAVSVKGHDLGSTSQVVIEGKNILADTATAGGDSGLDTIEEVVVKSQSSIGVSTKDDHFPELLSPPKADDQSSHRLESIDSIAKVATDVVAELDAMSSSTQDIASMGDERKLAESSDEAYIKDSGEENAHTKALASVAEASSPESAETTQNKPSIKDEFVGDKERELEEEEYVHHELSEAQIAWLRKH
jgi:hypothetical protein